MFIMLSVSSNLRTGFHEPPKSREINVPTTHFSTILSSPVSQTCEVRSNPHTYPTQLRNHSLLTKTVIIANLGSLSKTVIITNLVSTTSHRSGRLLPNLICAINTSVTLIAAFKPVRNNQKNLNEIVARGSAYACTVHSIPDLRTVCRLEAGWLH